jgi:serine protease Do
MNQHFIVSTTIVGLLTLAATAACGPGRAGSDRSEDEGGGSTPMKASLTERLGDAPDDVDLDAASALSGAFRAAAGRALPSVVYVSVEQEGGDDAGDLPPFFRFFHGDPEGEFEMPPRRGAGSGFVLDDQGHVATNAHVVADASYIRVRTLEGREFEAEVIASDSATDVAVLRVEPEEDALPAASLGDSDALNVGDMVLALGSPLGFDFTVTSGIISAKNRRLSMREEALEAFLQTDAAINPGNSGGPLVDLSGKVIGINTAIGGARRFAGYGFAIPINLARDVIDDLLEYGRVRRPMLGVNVSDVDAVDAEVYELDEVRGAEINAVRPDTPAADANLRPGDVIVALDGQPIADSTELITDLARREPGETVELALIRDGERRTVDVEMGEFETGEKTAANQDPPGEEPETVLGFSVERLSSELAQRIGYDEATGVVVASVARFGPAAAAGVRPGEKLVSINGTAIERVSDVRRVAGQIGERDVVSLRLRGPRGVDRVVNYRTRG